VVPFRLVFFINHGYFEDECDIILLALVINFDDDWLILLLLLLLLLYLWCDEWWWCWWWWLLCDTSLFASSSWIKCFDDIPVPNPPINPVPLFFCKKCGPSIISLCEASKSETDGAWWTDTFEFFRFILPLCCCCCLIWESLALRDWCLLFLCVISISLAESSITFNT